MISREDLIQYIREKEPNHEESYLETLSLESLVILKVQIELAIHRLETLTKNKKQEQPRKKTD